MSHSNFPLLEYDPSPRAELEPGHDAPGLRLPENCAFPFLGETVGDYAREHRLPVLGEFITITKRLPVYRVTETLCLCEAPMGAPVAASCLDWLIACGVRRVVAAGSCGALVDLPENAFVLPRRALRDEGTSFHYLPAARWIDLDGDVRGQIEGVFAAEGLPFVETDTWTTDAIFRETAEKIALRRADGCGVVEMECAALAAVARFRGAKFGQFLYTADSLANAEAYDERDWGADSLAPALRLCLKAASEE